MPTDRAGHVYVLHSATIDSIRTQNYAPLMNILQAARKGRSFLDSSSVGE